ncbi:hypothetical protein BT96DRAFT_940622 [Gymnopus androsaceus JB14]|uniref:F-box domain-containing protein n=1 Tax=Gymnopus androsaceus JB14 TaxID=1447944 RepID=A0A6A4HK13_9AGAR|nr:hypothetical protein BT96DRAFT_940622 [Gymnopus androsaceus JB14]
MSRMPLLKKLHVGSFLLSYKDYRALPCNWRNLINLVIEDCLSRSQLLSILAETPRIQSVSLAMFVGQEDSTFQASMVHLHDLKVLLLQWPFTGLPLQTLEILELTAPILPNALMECLSQTPKLISFHFTTIWHEFPLLDRHLSTITFSADQPAPLWPRLENIQLLTSTAMFHSAGSYLDNILRVRDEELQTLQKELESITSFTSGALTRFLESRSQTKLKTCDVFYPTKREPSFSEAELETLRELQRKGLKLRIHCITSHAGIDVHRDLPHGGLPVVFPDMESGFFGNEAWSCAACGTLSSLEVFEVKSIDETVVGSQANRTSTSTAFGQGLSDTGIKKRTTALTRQKWFRD